MLALRFHICDSVQVNFKMMYYETGNLFTKVKILTHEDRTGAPHQHHHKLDTKSKIYYIVITDIIQKCLTN
jgi:hypothetical protein